MTTTGPDAAEAFLRDFLSTATPQQRHTFVRRTNYDDGTDRLRFVLDDASTDRATALAAYWMLGAGYYAQYATVDDAADYERPTWELLRVVEQRYADGFWADHGIGFDPTDDEGDDWTTEYSEVVRPIPDAMREPVAGEPVDDDDTEDGLPLDVYEHYEALVD
ncbi:DUF4274 domain-containing protein [Cellulomonas sp. Leaf334]|uniref:DUF4274 domain-containing protein n=1 Tax=Cellulomonas sp. Leaf334 TaxID=1736339 RepID=UPI0006F5493D|nr:DUF4274 domain-containing protein [Cellulomonas sp. Leaf334]KQR07258.1 hypothetical protein ASF78_21365 [Cellulomonas sp. Leaf334]